MDVENGSKGIEGPKEQIGKIRMAYRIFGKEDALTHAIFEGGHMRYGGCLENRFFAERKAEEYGKIRAERQKQRVTL